MLRSPCRGERDVAMQTVVAPQLWLTLLERPELADDPRFATPVARRMNWPQWREIETG